MKRNAINKVNTVTDGNNREKKNSYLTEKPILLERTCSKINIASKT